MQLSAVRSVAGRTYAYKFVRSGAWVGEAYQVDHVETGAMSEAGEKQAEFVRLITIPSFVLFVIACVNFFVLATSGLSKILLLYGLWQVTRSQSNSRKTK